MSNDPAFYLAARARDLYTVSPCATWDELLTICRERRIAVIIDGRLDREGWYVQHPQCSQPVIILREQNPWVLAHELFHAWITDNLEAGIVYPYSEYADDDVEAAANRFACMMCGNLAERLQAMWDGCKLGIWARRRRRG